MLFCLYLNNRAHIGLTEFEKSLGCPTQVLHINGAFKPLDEHNTIARTSLLEFKQSLQETNYTQ